MFAYVKYTTTNLINPKPITFTMHPQELREKALSLVKQGLSINKTAQQLNISSASISRWCQQAGVKSKYKQIKPKTITEKDILKTVKGKKVATVREIAEALGVTYSILGRLRKLVREGKLKSIRIPKTHNSTIKRYLANYMNKTLFYINEEDFKKWYFSKLPRYVPKHLKRIFTHVLHDIGIEVEEKRETKTAIVLPKEIKQQLIEKAKQEGVSVEELLRRVI